MLEYKQLVRLPNEQLRHYPTESVNLACADGLPGSERIHVPFCTDRIDGLTRVVRDYTERSLPRFRSSRGQSGDTEAVFRVLCMVTVCEKFNGIRYDPSKTAEDAPFEVASSFLHGVLQ